MGEERLLGHHTEGELQCLQEHMLNCSQPHVGKTRKCLICLLVLLDVLVDEDRPTTARIAASIQCLLILLAKARTLLSVDSDMLSYFGITLGGTFDFQSSMDTNFFYL
jgi:hypothetical protein